MQLFSHEVNLQLSRDWESTTARLHSGARLPFDARKSLSRPAIALQSRRSGNRWAARFNYY